jgi:hypothetical protein
MGSKPLSVKNSSLAFPEGIPTSSAYVNPHEGLVSQTGCSCPAFVHYKRKENIWLLQKPFAAYRLLPVGTEGAQAPSFNYKPLNIYFLHPINMNFY